MTTRRNHDLGKKHRTFSGPERDERVRVLLVGQGAPTAGGIPSFLNDLQEDEWLRERISVELLNTAPTWTKTPGRMTFRNLRQAWRDARSVFRGATRNDVVHLNLAPAPLLPLLRATMLAAVARAGGSQVILHAHTGRLETSAANPLFRILLRACLRVVGTFIVVSEASAAVIGSMKGNAIHLGNGVDVDGIEPRRRTTRRPTIAFVGTVCERKGLLDLREALVRIRHSAPGNSLPAEVLIIGDAQQEGPGVFEKMQLLYREAGLDEVRFLGVLERGRVVEILERCDIFCLPSHWEGCPLSLLEAMAAGAAVVATRVGDIPAILGEGKAGILVDAHDVEALTSALTGLLSDRKEGLRLGTVARRRAEEAFNRSNVIRRVYYLYLEAADRH